MVLNGIMLMLGVDFSEMMIVFGVEISGITFSYASPALSLVLPSVPAPRTDLHSK